MGASVEKLKTTRRLVASERHLSSTLIKHRTGSLWGTQVGDLLSGMDLKLVVERVGVLKSGNVVPFTNFMLLVIWGK